MQVCTRGLQSLSCLRARRDHDPALELVVILFFFRCCGQFHSRNGHLAALFHWLFVPLLVSIVRLQVLKIKTTCMVELFVDIPVVQVEQRCKTAMHDAVH